MSKPKTKGKPKQSETSPNSTFEDPQALLNAFDQLAIQPEVQEDMARFAAFKAVSDEDLKLRLR